MISMRRMRLRLYKLGFPAVALWAIGATVYNFIGVLNEKAPTELAVFVSHSKCAEGSDPYPDVRPNRVPATGRRER